MQNLYPNLFPSFEELAGNPNFYDEVRGLLTKVYTDPKCIEGLEDDPASLNNGPAISVTNPLCPNSFKFTPNSNNGITIQSGLKNVAIAFNFSGVTREIRIGYIHVYMQSDIAILGPPAVLFANAINNATADIQNRINNGLILPNVDILEFKILYMNAIGRALTSLGISLLPSSNGATMASINTNVAFPGLRSATDMNSPTQVVFWNTATTLAGCP